MGMLIRRRIHEMQEKSREKENAKHQFDATEIPESEDITTDISETSEIVKKLSYEDLSSMTVKQIKELADKKGFSITKIIKEDVIAEFLSKQ